MIEQTIRDIRANLPDCEIIIMLDGIRPEQEDRRGAYAEYKRRLLWLAHHTWHNVLPIIFDEHMHQAAMTREALNQVATPTIFFVEHDAPITPDHDFDWQTLTDAIIPHAPAGQSPVGRQPAFNGQDVRQHPARFAEFETHDQQRLPH